MSRRWKWFLRRGEVALDLTGQVVPDGDVPGRLRRVVVEHVVPELRVTSRCDGAIVYERPEQRAGAAGNAGGGRYRRGRPGERNRGKFAPAAGEAAPAVGPVAPAPPDGDGDLLVTAAQLDRANRLVDVHWRRPGEDVRTRKCPDCRGDGTCPRAAWADSIIGRCLRAYWR